MTPPKLTKWQWRKMLLALSLAARDEREHAQCYPKPCRWSRKSLANANAFDKIASKIRIGFPEDTE